MSAKSNEIAITRIYDAPVKAVWDAWVDPDQVGQWWGPRGFTITTKQKDVRPGGTWTYTMHGPDGVDYPNKTYFHEVQNGALLVYDHGANDDRPPMFRVKVRFSALGTKTKMEMRMILPTPEAADQTRAFVKKAGGNATWDRLAEHLDEKLHNRDRFVINRTFECSIEKMYEIWTSPEHIANWLAPAGSTMEFLRADIRVGGEAFYRMVAETGMTFYGSTHYLELSKPTRLVYDQKFRTETGEISRHPLAPLWPETMRTVVEFSEEGPNETRVTLTWEPEGKVTREEVDVFRGARADMTQGWTGSLDKLEGFLRTAG
jgi:uncharacterized protein YndB with AHSA1/START domain